VHSPNKIRRDKFKNEDDGMEKELPYQHLEKSTVLLDCRVFHEHSVVSQNPRKCCLLITKLLFLIVKGESFTSAEVTEVFFGVTKLFQSDDVNLRRMMYLFIKEIAETCDSDDVIIVTASLTKDMNTGEDLYRANAMRVLAKIIDTTMLNAIERFLKQGIVDKNSFVASSALMSGLHLFTNSPEVVRRWVNEVQEAVNSTSDMVQYHALSLYFKIKQHDRLAVSKIVQQLSKGSLRSPLATCLLIRYTSSMLVEDMNSNNSANARAAYQFLENCLRHKSDMVIYEAAKAMCSLPNIDANDVAPAITVLQLFLTSAKPSLRCAAMRTLSEVAAAHPLSVAKCNEDMEALVADTNRSIATLAITTLLKTGSESSVDRLMKQISTFMSEIGDEFKVVVVRAIRELCIKYPAKHRVMVGFLSTFLREEGGADFKKSIVDSIVELMTAIPETKETSLLHLCEFIEDCEFPDLIVQILHLIGTAGPGTVAPARYIRFIFNRVILENAIVRAAAVSTLGCFGTRAPELRPAVIALLQRSIADDDDEVRDRAAVLLETFQLAADEDELRLLLDEPLPMSFAVLEKSIKALAAHSGGSDRAITFASLPVIEEAAVTAAAPSSRAAKKKVAQSSEAASEAVDPASAVYAVPELAKLGRAFRSCPSAALTETEMEYVVSCVKHILADHVVLQFTVLNTIDDQSLRNVRVLVAVDDEEGYAVEKVIAAPVVKYGEPSSCFVALKRLGNPGPLTVSCELHFKVVQVDPATGAVEGDEVGYDEEYPLETLEIGTSDYMARGSTGDFKRSWEDMGTDGEVLGKFALTFKRLEDAVAAVINFVGMQPVDGTATVTPDLGTGKRSHVLHLSGIFIGNVPVLARAQIQMDSEAGAGVVLKIAIRSESKDISEIVSGCIN
jgi:coatomer protein complex subunit gamma